LNWVDFAIIAVIVWFTFASLRAGFIREACALMGAVFGVVLAGQFLRALRQGHRGVHRRRARR
jgi:uncharacterized membrane protein required for colicin V production